MEKDELKNVIKEVLREYDTEKVKEHEVYIDSQFDAETEVKYPNQVDAVVRQKKTLGIDAFLSIPDVKSGNSPLEMHSGYSRYVLTILDSTSGMMKTIHANVPANDVALIKKKTDLAIEKIFKAKNAVKEELSPAYTVSLVSREYSSKTPAQVLLEDEENKAKLLKTKSWLEDNLAKYPRNKEQIDAIDDAINLLELGMLEDKSDPETNQVIEIYSEDIKIPNARKLNENKKTFVYSISICCKPENDFPFGVNIMNCYAPVIKNPYGQIIAEMGKAEKMEKTSIMLTEKEWFRVINKMDSVTKMFEKENYPYLMELSKSKSYFK